MYLLLYPLLVVEFYYVDGTRFLVHSTKNLTIYTIKLLSIPLLAKTFFKPLKNEYHQGLIRFSIIAGIIVKTILITVSTCIVATIILICTMLTVIYLLAPVLIIYLAIR